ncbi:non-structural protein [Sango virus]|uniref:Non-structural protein NS-S n=1 Tax=Sango virus TaxID=159152 RepID=J4FCT7_9VIRU|nr:non-structural protein [Sango virus]CCG93486.1 non-structural protein [Sango virus]
MFLNGISLRLTRRLGMWHLLLNMGPNSILIPLESSSSIRRRPRWCSVRRHNRVLILHLEASNLHWLITIFPNTQQILCQTLPSLSTASQAI